MQTRIPADMQKYIDEFIGHQDYAPYVLDGQVADLIGDEDDYHDVVVLEDRPEGMRVIKFTRYPSGRIVGNWELRE